MSNTLAGLDSAIFVKNLSVKDSVKGNDAKVASTKKESPKKDDVVSFSGQLDKEINSKSQKEDKKEETEPTVTQQAIAQLQELSTSVNKPEIPVEAQNQDVDLESVNKIDVSGNNKAGLTLATKDLAVTSEATVDLEVEGFKESVDAVKASKQSLANITQDKSSNVDVGKKPVVELESKTMDGPQVSNVKTKAVSLDGNIEGKIKSSEVSKELANTSEAPKHISQANSAGKTHKIEKSTILSDSKQSSTEVSQQAKTVSLEEITQKTIRGDLKGKSLVAEHKEVNLSDVAVPQEQQIASTSATSSVSNDDALAVQDVARQVIDDIRVNFSPDTKSMTIALDPPELGKINIRMVQSDQGLSGVMQVQSSEVRDHLQRELPQVIATLHNSGIDVKKVEVVLASDNNSSAFESDSASSSMGQGNAGTQTQEGESLQSSSIDLSTTQRELEVVGDDSINVYV